MQTMMREAERRHRRHLEDAEPPTTDPRRGPGVCSPGGSRRGVRVPLLALCGLLLAASPLLGDRVLIFRTSNRTIAGAASAEVMIDGLAVIRLRAAQASSLTGKAEIIARRLRELALEGLKPEQLAVEKVAGQWALTGAGQLIVTADADTAQAAGMTPQSLCESWRVRLADALREPYVTVAPDELILVPLGETRSVRFGGTIAALPSVESMSPEAATAEVDRAAGRIVFTGRGVGSTVATITVGRTRHAITVEVKRWAARMVAQATARTTGPDLDPEMAEVAALNAVLDAVNAEAGATVHIVPKTATATGLTVSMRAGGADFIPVAGDIDVTLVGGLPPIPTAQALLVSNCPERVTGVGALMRQSLVIGRPTRLLWHHKNYAGRSIVLAVRLINAGPETASLRVGWADAGPDPDEIFVGFNAMRRYWETVMRGQALQLRIPAGSSFETVATPMASTDVVSGLMDIVVDQGSELYVEVVGREPRDDPAGFARLRNPGDPLAVTPFEFPAMLDGELSYELGGRFAHLSIGRDPVVNEQGVALDGAYGVMHRLRVALHNPGPAIGRVEIVTRAGGGIARVVARIDGTAVSSTLLRAGEEEVLAKYDLAPGTGRVVSVQLIPTAGSNLPITLAVRGNAR